MQKPPVQFLAAALDVMKELDRIAPNFNCTSPTSGSPAANENTVAKSSGINPKVDFVSIPGVCLHLHLKLYAAREHLLSCLYLLGSDAERTLVNSIQSLARSALEGAVTCLWLCSNKNNWEERLRRFSQLHLKSAYTSLKEEGIDLNNRPDASTVAENIVLTMEECDTLIKEVKARGWLCKKGKNEGKTPTIRRWVGELPTHSDIMKDAAAILQVDPEPLRVLYSLSSRSVHTDPVTVASGSTEEDEDERLSLAVGAITTALMFYELAWRLLASWFSVPYPEDAMREPCG